MNEVAGVLVLGVLWCGLAGAVVGSQKRAGLMGALWGVVFGPLGVVVALSLDERPKCPRCGGRLNGEPEICQHCHSPLTWVPSPFVRKPVVQEPRKAEQPVQHDREIAEDAEKELPPLLVLGLGDTEETEEAAATLIGPPEAPRAAIRTWTDTTGKRIDAEFVGVAAGKVRLKRADGSTGTFPLDRLSTEDQAWVKTQALR